MPAGSVKRDVPNRLAHETSPYLLQHRDNPVDWFAWGPEALERSRELDRPLLVSIGYSACHWCHVMEHESFEDPQIAAVMNEHFVPIKVDREERPDIDALCMEACQAMTGQGGWPLNAFLTPDQAPFYTGTYFPPEPRHGLPSWRMVLVAIAEAWQKRREEIVEQGARVAHSLGATARIQPSADPVREASVAAAVAALGAGYDTAHGGWGRAPKFPPTPVLELLMARGERAMSLHTLREMARGGIYDQLGGGFSRYAVDATWTVPHFEKMLYDNALLARAYLHGWLVCREPRFQAVCSRTLDWALREMQGPEGGFCSALDADSEGVEGKFYVWSPEQIRGALGDGLAAEAMGYFGVSEPGNFEHGLSVLEARGPQPERLEEIRARLLEVRAQRVRPGLDDKRLTSWNALMVTALAEAGAVLAHPPYLQAAERCAAFLLEELRDGEGRLLRTWKAGRAQIPAYLEDHAYLLQAMLALYEATLQARWYREAVGLAETLIDRFADPEHGGFFTTASDHERLIARRKDLEDTPIPSGNSAAALGLLRLARVSGEQRYERHAAEVLALLLPLAARAPQAFGHLLQAADLYLASAQEVAVVGPDPEPLLKVIRSELRPHLVLAGGPEGDVPLLEGREPVEGRATAYVCEHFVCQAPVTSPDALAALL